jgi:hypothetical protein
MTKVRVACVKPSSQARESREPQGRRSLGNRKGNQMATAWSSRSPVETREIDGRHGTIASHECGRGRRYRRTEDVGRRIHGGGRG